MDSYLDPTPWGCLKEKTGLKGKAIFMPIRAAITGRIRGPELDKVTGILGKTALMKRLERSMAG